MAILKVAVRSTTGAQVGWIVHGTASQRWFVEGDFTGHRFLTAHQAAERLRAIRFLADPVIIDWKTRQQIEEPRLEGR